MTTQVISIFVITTLLLGAMVNGQGLLRPERVDQYVRDIMKCAGIPDLSLSFISSKTAYNQVFRQQNQNIRKGSSSNSAFCIGGATQAFTAVLLAKLIDENENVTWSTPVQDILGRRVVLPDYYRTNNLNLKDILSMRSGITGMDIVTVTKPFSVRRLIRNLRFAPVVAGFRDEFIYNEVLFALIEDVVSQLAGDSWQNVMKSHILEPLNMRDTFFIGEESQNVELTKGAVDYNGNPYRIGAESYSGLELVAPAASLCTTADDMSRWMRFLLSRGRGVTQIVRAEALEMTYDAIQSRGNGDPTIQGYRQGGSVTVSYTLDHNALGWIKGNYRGFSFISQDGSLPGYQTLATIIPSKDIGVYVTFTGDKGPKSFAAKVLLNTLGIDFLLGSQPWFADARDCSILDRMVELHRNREEDPFRNIVRASNFQGYRELDTYANFYRNYAFGDVVVKVNNTRDDPLTMEYGTAVYRLAPTNTNDTFQLLALGGHLWYSTNADYYRNYQPLYAVFSPDPRDPENRINSVTIHGYDRNVNPVFSTNARPPRYEEEPGYGAKCSATNCVISLWSLLLLAVMAFLR